MGGTIRNLGRGNKKLAGGQVNLIQGNNGTGTPHLSWGLKITRIIELLCHCKGGNFNLGVVQLFYPFKEGNHVLSIWYSVNKLFEPRKRACIS